MWTDRVRQGYAQAGIFPPPPPTHYLGLDLGQAKDYTAIAIIKERVSDTEPTAYEVRHLDRFALGLSYVGMVEAVRQMMGAPELHGCTRLVLDQTGVGRPIFDLFETAGLEPVGITIHGGGSVTRGDWGNEFRVPKRDLIMCTRALLEERRLKYPRDLPNMRILIDEMRNVDIRVNPATAHESYLAWREGTHDDLILALCLACWMAENGPTPLEVGPNPLADYRG